jgi:superfamily II DNA or RNA helicase
MPKSDDKPALVIQPAFILKNKLPVRAIHIGKKEKLVHYTIKDLLPIDITVAFPLLPKTAKEGLQFFCGKALAIFEAEVKDKYQRQSWPIDYDTFFHQAFIRQLHSKFDSLKPFSHLLKWYHQTPNSKTGNLMTAPCTFSTYRPMLDFEVVMIDGRYAWETYISVGQHRSLLADFRQYAFLLESANEYFLLSYKDFQTLEWLASAGMESYGSQPAVFIENVLTRLEKDYTVNRNRLFPVTEISSLPVNRVVLSEISSTFLVLTPQWLYEGFVLEGSFAPFYETLLKGESYVVKRNKEAEEAFMQMLASLHPSFAAQKNGTFFLSFAEAQRGQWFANTYHYLLAANIELIGMDMLKYFRYSPHPPLSRLQLLQTNEKAVLIHFTLHFGNEAVPLPELQKTVLAGQKAVMLKDGSMGILTEAWMAEYGNMVRHGKVRAGGEMMVPRWLAITITAEETMDNSLQPVIQQDWWQRWLQWQNGETHLYPLPTQLKVQPRGYQRKGFEWLMLLAEVGAGACLADDMGLGKTLQTICFMAARQQQNPLSQAMVVCPASLMYNWAAELKKFAPHLRYHIHHGAQRSTSALERPAGADVIITSYGTLRADIAAFSLMAFDIAIIDESHNIKNNASQISRAVHQLNAACRVALSGTPVMNNTMDLYAQLHFLVPDMFGSSGFFKREYADPIDIQNDEAKRKQLQKLTAPFILRRTKEQVAPDLPEKVETVLWCRMGQEQENLYNEVKERIRDSVFLGIESQGLDRSKLAVMQGIMKLKQVCASPLLLPQDERTAYASAKIELLLHELQSNLKGRKVLVFSQFASLLHLVAKELTARGILFYHFDGQTDARQRSERINRFQSEQDGVNVFLISLMAGNAGITLTAASYVFLLDPWWNKAVEDQAINRTHRIGQTQNVFAYKMICKDTIEEKIVDLQQRKKQLSNELIGAEEGFAKSLSREDVEYLFS